MSDITNQLVFSKRNGVGLIQLDNQAKRNAMTFDMWQGIPKVLDDFESDEEEDEGISNLSKTELKELIRDVVMDTLDEEDDLNEIIENITNS